MGLLHAAPGIGALIAALLTGWVTAVRRQGRAIVVSVVMYGAAIAAFGFSRTLWVALVLLALASAADIVSNIFLTSCCKSQFPMTSGEGIGAQGRACRRRPAIGGRSRRGICACRRPGDVTGDRRTAHRLSAVTIAGAGRSIWRQKVGGPEYQRARQRAELGLIGVNAVLVAHGPLWTTSRSSPSA